MRSQTSPLVPGSFDVTVHIVLNDFPLGRAFARPTKSRLTKRPSSKAS
jgi:hypothetical protein